MCGCVCPTVEFSGLQSLKLASLLAQLLTGQDGEGMTRPPLPLIGSCGNSTQVLFLNTLIRNSTLLVPESNQRERANQSRGGRVTVTETYCYLLLFPVGQMRTSVCLCRVCAVALAARTSRVPSCVNVTDKVTSSTPAAGSV